MAMKKIGTPERGLEVAYFGEEARVVNEHLRKVGKPLSEFSNQENQDLQAELKSLSSNDEPVAEEPEEQGADTEDDNE